MENTNNENAGKEMIIYQLENQQPIEVRVCDDTVWLTQLQMTQLFQTTKQNISMHIKNIYKEGELDYNASVKDFLTVQDEGGRQVQRTVVHYNLDVIISVGYRVKSIYGTKFRMWATSVLKKYFYGRQDYQRLERMENRITTVESQVANILQTALPPKQGVFFQGQIFDAYQFVADLVRSAKTSILLIDNYVDDSVLKLLSKRREGVSATILVNQISQGLKLDVQRHNAQYPHVEIKGVAGIHDRFLLLDDTELYTFGSSFKDLGKKLFCFSKIECAEVVNAVRNL